MVEKIAKLASESGLEFEKCYTITLLYYLCQFNDIDIRNIPVDYQSSVRLLYKNLFGSYIHYITEIMYSNDEYVKAIKDAEIELYGGDDPRCPW